MIDVVTGRIGEAAFSPCRLFRYRATYAFVPAPRRSVTFLLLNPSTATHDELDPTLRRCRAFALREGCERMTIVNLYAFRATDPADMWRAADPIGPGNDAAIAAACKGADLVICGWGAHGARNGRGAEVRAQLLADGVELHHLGLTKAGEPKHPLYLAGETPLTRWV